MDSDSREQSDDEQEVIHSHFPKYFGTAYPANKDSLKMSVKIIMLKRKRERKSIDRILFKQKYNYSSKQEKKEVERDRSDYIKFLNQKYPNQFPQELFITNKQIKKQTNVNKNNKPQRISAIDIMESNINKLQSNKNKEKKDKKDKTQKGEDDDDVDNNNEDREVENMNFEEIMQDNNNSSGDDDIFQGDGDYEYE